jgi:ribosome biogenesis GTPase A
MRTTYNFLLQISQMIEHHLFLRAQLDEITRLLEQLDRQGINFNFVGPRNVGKSALINLLLHSDAAMLHLSDKLIITETPSENWDDSNLILSIAEDETDFICMV